jgi:hypothetical protein
VLPKPQGSELVITFDIASNTTAPAEATHIIVFAANGLGTLTEGTGTPLRDTYVPPPMPLNTVFSDTNATAGLVSGVIWLTRPSQQAGITALAIYLGKPLCSKDLLVGVVPLNGTMSTDPTPSAQLCPQVIHNATHVGCGSLTAWKLPPNSSQINVFVQVNGAQSKWCAETLFHDYSAQFPAPQSLEFLDTDGSFNKIGGVVTLLSACDSLMCEKEIRAYSIYFGYGHTKAGPPVLSIESDQDVLAKELPQGTSMPDGATHLLAFARGVDGESQHGSAFEFSDVVTTIRLQSYVDLSSTKGQMKASQVQLAIPKIQTDFDSVLNVPAGSFKIWVVENVEQRRLQAAANQREIRITFTITVSGSADAHAAWRNLKSLEQPEHKLTKELAAVLRSTFAAETIISQGEIIYINGAKPWLVSADENSFQSAQLVSDLQPQLLPTREKELASSPIFRWAAGLSSFFSTFFITLLSALGIYTYNFWKDAEERKCLVEPQDDKQVAPEPEPDTHDSPRSRHDSPRSRDAIGIDDVVIDEVDPLAEHDGPVPGEDGFWDFQDDDGEPVVDVNQSCWDAIEDVEVTQLPSPNRAQPMNFYDDEDMWLLTGLGSGHRPSTPKLRDDDYVEDLAEIDVILALEDVVIHARPASTATSRAQSRATSRAQSRASSRPPSRDYEHAGDESDGVKEEENSEESVFDKHTLRFVVLDV